MESRKKGAKEGKEGLDIKSEMNCFSNNYSPIKLFVPRINASCRIRELFIGIKLK